MAAHPDDRSPSVPTAVTLRRLDEIAWTPVQRQRNADGSESEIRERWPIIRPGCLSAWVHYGPGMVVRRHGHRSNHVVVVLEGSGHLGDEPCGPGTHVHVPLGATFGPIVAGPEGLVCWEVSFGEFGGWGDEPERFAAAVAEHGVTPLPDPPIDLGDWFVDPRNDWGGERPSPRIPGLAEVSTQPADLPERESAPGVRSRRAIDSPNFRSETLELAPGADVGLPAATAHRLLLVVDGSVTLDGVTAVAPAHLEVPQGCSTGILQAGADGAKVLLLADGPLGA